MATEEEKEGSSLSTCSSCRMRLHVSLTAAIPELTRDRLPIGLPCLRFRLELVFRAVVAPLAGLPAGRTCQAGSPALRRTCQRHGWLCPLDLRCGVDGSVDGEEGGCWLGGC